MIKVGDRIKHRRVTIPTFKTPNQYRQKLDEMKVWDTFEVYGRAIQRVQYAATMIHKDGSGRKYKMTGHKTGKLVRRIR